MNKISGVLARLLVPAFFVAGVIATPAMAQDKNGDKNVGKALAGQATYIEVTQNDKLRVYEATYKPGDVSPSAKRPMRAVRALKGGTLERTYEDGTKETIQWKTGEVKIISEERPYAVKNIGKGVVHLYGVEVK